MLDIFSLIPILFAFSYTSMIIPSFFPQYINTKLLKKFLGPEPTVRAGYLRRGSWNVSILGAPHYMG